MHTRLCHEGEALYGIGRGAVEADLLERQSNPTSQPLLGQLIGRHCGGGIGRRLWWAN
jgi:hypothetical protein